MSDITATGKMANGKLGNRKTRQQKIQTYQNKAKNLYTIYFVFDLDGECKFIKLKQNIIVVIKEICSS